MTNYEYISYTQFEGMMRALTIIIQARVEKYDFIYAPPRGGWPVAVHLSHHLQVPIFPMINLLKPHSQTTVLWVDDIVDSGKSLTYFSHLVDRWGILSTTCSLFYKTRASVRPDICLRTVSDDTWVVFPWERREDAEAERSEYAGRQESD